MGEMDTREAETQRVLSNLRWHFAALAVQLSIVKVGFTLKAGFRPDQPRVPRGRPDGGQWTDEVVPVGGRGRGGGPPRRIGGRWTNVRPDQEARLAVSRGEMQEALRAVRRLDPKWRPTPQLYETVEGAIAANQAIAQEARFRLFELTNARVGPGPFAREWIPAPTTNRELSATERQEINRIGRRFGCHWCGSKDPKTGSGNLLVTTRCQQRSANLSGFTPTAWRAADRKAGWLEDSSGGGIIDMQTRIIRPEYSSFYIAGPRAVRLPQFPENAGLAVAPDCIGVGCLMHQDGGTSVTLGLSSEIDLLSRPSFDGILQTPDRVVQLFDANNPEIMRADVSETKTRVRIWMDHPIEPDEVTILLG
jgi:hypothetical protein